ncbi:MAG TPA: ChbG/HpnK family deacetylase, partial [Microthrixaceae bacterium]|nr:ChbG/HpnK family deacetylase [Microthrixaceae bacterium]
MTTLAQRLGFADDERVVIVTCDEFGLSHASNEGCLAALDGVATSASLLVPAPWSRSAVAYSVGLDVGVGLTLNSPFDRYRWGPITHAPSLLDGDGGFPRTLDDSWDHADLDEVRRECRAQIERAGLWGLEVSHVS